MRLWSTRSRPFSLFPRPPAPELYTLSLHDALPICRSDRHLDAAVGLQPVRFCLLHLPAAPVLPRPARSEEHTSELQSRGHLVCRLLLEKKKHAYSRDRNGTDSDNDSSAASIHALAR